MKSNQEKYELNLGLIRRGRILFPDERNLTALIKKTSALLGIPIQLLTSASPVHPQIPHKFKPFFKCPRCGIQKLSITDICRSCKEPDHGKYNSILSCSACGLTEKSLKHVVTLLQELGHDFSSIRKEDLGIRTLTDEGLK